MSRYEHEYGDISIPRSEWAALKKAVRDAHNAQQQRRYDFALTFHAKLVASAKGIRDADWNLLTEKLIQGWHGVFPEESHDIRWRLFQAATNRLTKQAGRHVDGSSVRGTAGRPPKPTRSMWPDATNRTAPFHFDDGSISFDEKTAVVGWRVEENNHAIERARRNAVAVTFFAALDRVAWTPKTGGSLYGNDEYARESHGGEGSGGDYVTARYGRDRTEYEKTFAPARRSASIHGSGPFSPYPTSRW